MSDILRTSEERRRRALIDNAIARSSSKAELVGHLEGTEASDIAESLEGKALIASKSPWGVAIAYILGLVIAHYGFHASPETVAVITGLFVLAGGYAMRMITHAPITGLIRPGPV